MQFPFNYIFSLLCGEVTVYAEKPDRSNTQIKNDARQRVFVVGQRNPFIYNI